MYSNNNLIYLVNEKEFIYQFTETAHILFINYAHKFVPEELLKRTAFKNTDSNWKIHLTMEADLKYNGISEIYNSAPIMLSANFQIVFEKQIDTLYYKVDLITDTIIVANHSNVLRNLYDTVCKNCHKHFFECTDIYEPLQFAFTKSDINNMVLKESFKRNEVFYNFIERCKDGLELGDDVQQQEPEITLDTEQIEVVKSVAKMTKTPLDKAMQVAIEQKKLGKSTEEIAKKLLQG